jgi:diketogulonate reductase-like aldo/keto reductase
MHGEGDILLSVAKTLKDLRLDYLDLFLVHWPFPNHHATGVSVNSRDPHAVPYIHENYMKTWRQMERLVDMGLVKAIGTSNVTVPKLKLILRDARIKPAVNEMELHPHFQQPALFQFCLDNNIVPIGYSPIGSPNRPDRDKTDTDTVDVEDPVVVAIAKRLGVHPALVCLKWAVQRGQIPIPFSIHRKNYLANIRSVTENLLSDDEMKAMAGIDRNCRLIKGQVFLWPTAKDWPDLWDEDGTIAGA